MNLEREKDVEQLRRIALALQVANQHLADALARKCKELEALKGDPTELQRTLRSLLTAATGAGAVLGLTRFSGQLNCTTNSGSALPSYAALPSKGNSSVVSKPRG